MTTFHLLPKNGGWILTQEDNPDPLQNYVIETKGEAEDLAIEYVFEQTDDGSHRIHREMAHLKKKEHILTQQIR